MARTGRPKATIAAKRTHRLIVPLKRLERVELQSAARATGLALASWARAELLKAARS